MVRLIISIKLDYDFYTLTKDLVRVWKVEEDRYLSFMFQDSRDISEPRYKILSWGLFSYGIEIEYELESDARHHLHDIQQFLKKYRKEIQ